MSEEKKGITDVATLATLFGLTAVRVQQLAQDGIVIKEGRGQYKLWPSIKNYIEYLKTKKSNQWGGGTGDDAANFEYERALLTKAKREEAEIRTAVIKGRVHEGAAVRELWIDMLMAARAKLLALPTKAAPQVAPENAGPALEILTELVHEALAELSDYDPARIAERTDTARLFSDAAPGDYGALGTTTEADGESVGGPIPDASGGIVG